MKKRTVKRLIFIPLGTIIGLAALVLGGALLLLTPERLTPLVVQMCDRYLDAQVRIDTVDVSLFRNFPHITLQLRGTEIISHAFDRLDDTTVRKSLPVEADTLARVQRLELSVNALPLIRGRIDIRRIALEQAHLHACIAPDGTANWDIYRSDSTETETEADSTALVVNIDRISIRNGLHIVYDSRPDDFAGHIELQTLFVRGRLSSELLQNDIRQLRLRHGTIAWQSGGQIHSAVIDSLTVAGRRQVDYTLNLRGREVVLDNVRWLDSLQFGTRLQFRGKDHKDLVVSDFGLRMNDMHIAADGQAAFRDDSIYTRFGVHTRGLRLASLLRAVPAEILPLAHDYETDLTTDLDLQVEGPFVASAGILPDVTADWRIPAGYLYYTKDRHGSRIDTLAIDATLRYRPRQPDSTGIELRDLRVSGIGLKLAAVGRADRLTGDAGFSGRMSGDLSLDYLTQHFPSSKGTTVRGRIAWDLEGETRLSQLDLGRIGGARISGHLTVDTLLVDMPQEEIHLMVGHGRVGAGTGQTRTDSLMVRGTQAVGAALSVDTIDMDLGQAYCLTGKNIRLQAATSAKAVVRDTTAVHPSQGVLSATGLRIDLGDSTVFIGRGLESQWSIRPAADDVRIPRLALQMQARRLSLREAANRFTIRQGSVGIEATLYRPDSTQLQRREQRLDSLQRLYPEVARDSLFAYARTLRGDRQRTDSGFSDSDLDLRVSSDLGEVLRRWQVNGEIKAQSGRIVTPYFPMTTTLRDVDLGFSTDEIRLNRTFVKSGQSQMVLTGDVRGLRRAMLGRGGLQGNLTVEADTLNLNQIVRVAHAGTELVAQGGVDHAESDEVFGERLAASADTTAAEGTLLLVPGNIDMTFDMTVHHGVYANLALDSLAGEVVARNRVLQLSNLVMRSNAGTLRMTGLYATRTPQDIQAGFDLEMEKMQVARLIELVPAIDTLMPMLRSFEGVVDCQIAAAVRLDSAMNMLLPTLNAACHLDGDSLVLMDGETFTEISKKLMFKNKKRNLIDHISAEVLVRDSQIEIFPFVVEIDRYRVAVSGVHKMDMTFNYHISVLKSPIPFRLGIDIFGDLDDFDFKITRARYKSAELPTRVALIEDTRMNLRNYIREVFLRGPRTEDRARLRITPETVSPTDLLPPADSLGAEEAAQLQQFDPVVLEEKGVE